MQYVCDTCTVADEPFLVACKRCGLKTCRHVALDFTNKSAVCMPCATPEERMKVILKTALRLNQEQHIRFLERKKNDDASG